MDQSLEHGECCERRRVERPTIIEAGRQLGSVTPAQDPARVVAPAPGAGVVS